MQRKNKEKTKFFRCVGGDAKSHHRLKVAKVAKVANDVSASFYMKQISKTDIRLWMDMMMKKKEERNH